MNMQWQVQMCLQFFTEWLHGTRLIAYDLAEIIGYLIGFCDLAVR